MPWYILLWLLSFKGNYQKVSPVIIQPTVMQRAGPGVVPSACRVIEVKGATVTSVCP